MQKLLKGLSPLATTTNAGLMSAEDKNKLNNLQGYENAISIRDEVPYTFRQTADGQNVGQLASDTIIGGTLFWNQGAKYIGDSETEYTCSTDTCTGTVSDGIYTATVTADSGDVYIASPNVSTGGNYSIHLMFATVRPSVNTLETTLEYGNVSIVQTMACPANQWTTIGGIYTNSAGKAKPINIYFDKSSSHNFTIGDTIQIKNVQSFNLTRMFTYDTIAEYIQSLEQTTPGAGLAWFKKLFPNERYAKIGEGPISIYTDAFHMKGFNQFTESKGGLQVLKGIEYEIIGAYNSLTLNGETITPVNNKFTPSSTGFLIITGYNSTTCVHFTRDNSRNGEYEKYKLETYPLTLTPLRGLPHLDSNNNLYYDGDEYRSDGTIIRKYNAIAFQDLTWEDYGETGSHTFRASLPNMKNGTLNATGTYNYKPYSTMAEWLAGDTMTFYKNSDGYLYVRNNTYGDAAAYTAAVTGNHKLVLLYERERPVFQTGISFPAIRVANSWGIEQYHTDYSSVDVEIPIGHRTEYISTNVNTLASNLLLSKLPETINDKSSAVILTYGVSTYEDFINAYQANKVIYLKTPVDPSNNPNNEYPRYAAVSYVNPDLSYVEFLYYRTQERNSSRLSDECIIYTLSKTDGWDNATRYAGIRQILTEGGGLSVSNWSSGTGKLTLTTSAFTGATSEANGTSGLVPAPTSSDTAKFLRGDGTWATVTGGGGGGGITGVNLVSASLVPDANGVVTLPAMTGCSSSAAGAAGVVPAPSSGDQEKFLAGDGTWKAGGLPMVILSYGNSTWQSFIDAYNNNVIVYCRASSSSNPASGNQTRMAFMAYVNNPTTPTEVEFQYYRSVSSHTSSTMGDEVYVYKLNSSGTWSVTKRDASLKEIVNNSTAISLSYSSNKITISDA